MAWTEVHWRSAILEKQTTAQVFLPDVGRPPFPTLYLLHGLGDDSTIWMRRSRLEVYVRDYPMIVVMPDGYRGFYTDNEQGPAFAQHTGEELVAFIERTFHARSERSARAIGGLSMGGYGAFRIALGYPDRFCSAHSHSGAFARELDLNPNPEKRRGVMRDRPGGFVEELKRVFGASPKNSRHDVLNLAIAAKRSRLLPKLKFDCGKDDYLLEANRAFHAELRAAKIPHVYSEYEGAHTWDYWDLHIREALAFHAKAMNVVRF